MMLPSAKMLHKARVEGALIGFVLEVLNFEGAEEGLYRRFDHVAGCVGEGVGDKIGKIGDLVVLPGVATHVKNEVQHLYWSYWRSI